MATLMIRLQGPMQAWGTRSRFDTRDTEMEPSKSGVLGLICAAMGIDRANWQDLEPLTALRMGVREDQAGILSMDYQTAQQMDEKGKDYGTSISRRYYLANALFVVGLEGDRGLLERIQQALKNPRWLLCLGRKAFPPSEPVYFSDQEAIWDLPLEEALKMLPWQGQNGPVPSELRLIIELTAEPTGGGMLARKRDQPIASFAERKYRYRLVEISKVEVKA